MNIASELSNWLKTKPGPFRAATLDEVWAAVFAAARAANNEFNKIGIQAFKEALIRCGYDAAHRGGHSGIAEHHVIGLPEHQSGSRS